MDKNDIRDLRERRPNNNRSVERTAFAFIDIETTGLYPERGARITEIAIYNRWEKYLHWMQQKDNHDDRALTLKFPAILDCLTTGVVVGHNVCFDLRFIAYEADRLNFRGPNVWFIDTLRLAKQHCNDVPEYKLSSLLEFFNISADGPLHTAAVDARCTRALFWQLVSKGNIETLSQAGMQQLNWSTF